MICHRWIMAEDNDIMMEHMINKGDSYDYCSNI